MKSNVGRLDGWARLLGGYRIDDLAHSRNAIGRKVAKLGVLANGDGPTVMLGVPTAWATHAGPLSFPMKRTRFPNAVAQFRGADGRPLQRTNDDAERRCHANRRRTADPQAADRLPHLLDGPAIAEDDFAGQAGLIE